MRVHFFFNSDPTMLIIAIAAVLSTTTYLLESDKKKNFQVATNFSSFFENCFELVVLPEIFSGGTILTMKTTFHSH